MEYRSSGKGRWTSMPIYFRSVKKLLGYIPLRLRNRYGATALALLAWIVFFDRNDAWTTFKNRRELARMQEQKEQYIADISSTKEHLNELSSDKKLLEKFAREEYLMKRPDEDIFVLVAEKR